MMSAETRYVWERTHEQPRGPFPTRDAAAADALTVIADGEQAQLYLLTETGRDYCGFVKREGGLHGYVRANG